MRREHESDVRGPLFGFLSVVGLVAWSFLFFRATAAGRASAQGGLEVLKLVLVVGGGGLAVLGWRGTSVGATAGMPLRPLRDGVPTEDGAYRLVRFPTTGGVMIAFSAGLMVSLTLVVPFIYLVLVWWRWSIWLDSVLDRSYPTYAAYRARVRHRFIPLIW
jgi:protein-S-isoprenylcysteine O-methyltransferase Ste14